MSKRLKYFLMIRVLPPLVHLFLRALRLTLKVRHVNLEPARAIWDTGRSAIFCFWHGRLLAMPYSYTRGNARVLISRHGDGEFIARVIRHFGLGAIRGSHRKEGSVSSLREMAAALKQGVDVAITPDGPKGPRHVVKKGLTELARISGRPIVPVTYGASKKKFFDPGTGSFFRTPFPRLSLSGATP